MSEPFYTHWTPAPPSGKSVADIITNAMGQDFRPERLTDRQRTALLAWAPRVNIAGDRGSLDAQRSIYEAGVRRELVAKLDEARRPAA
jgi:hypothetical protein